MKRPTLDQLLSRAFEIQSQLEFVKELYRELDSIVDKLTEYPSPIRTKKFYAEIVDNFEKRNTCFRSTPFRRYELTFKPSDKMIFKVRRSRK